MNYIYVILKVVPLKKQKKTNIRGASESVRSLKEIASDKLANMKGLLAEIVTTLEVSRRTKELDSSNLILPFPQFKSQPLPVLAIVNKSEHGNFPGKKLD